MDGNADLLQRPVDDELVKSGELYALGVAELVRGYAQGELSPVEVTQSVLDRVSHWEDKLQATWLLRPDAALEQAQASEARWRRGAPLGPLDGVPVTIKENIATRGDPLPAGTAAVDLVPAAADAPPPRYCTAWPYA